MKYATEYMFYLDGYDTGISHGSDISEEVSDDEEYPDASHRYANLLGYHNGKTRRDPLSPMQFIALMDANRP